MDEEDRTITEGAGNPAAEDAGNPAEEAVGVSEAENPVAEGAAAEGAVTKDPAARDRADGSAATAMADADSAEGNMAAEGTAEGNPDETAAGNPTADEMTAVTVERNPAAESAEDMAAEGVAEGNPDETAAESAEATAESDAEDTAKGLHPHRPVFSFVRRSSHLEPRMQRAWDEYAPRYLLQIPDAGHTLTVAPDFRLTPQWVAGAWGADRPLIVEIGTGQGENIVAAAQRRPDVNFLAVEVYDPGVAHTLLKAGKENLGNLRVAQVNAPELIAACAWGVIDELWTFFPDPWPKMKHHKRRLIQPALAADAHAALKRGGLWRIATDIDDYALHVHEVMDTAPGFANRGTRRASLPTRHVGKGNAGEAAALPHADFTESERFEGRVLTNFERKGLDAGRTIHDFTYQAV